MLALSIKRLECRVLAVTLWLGTFYGCADRLNGVPTVDVTGTVTYEGNPIDGATVTFHPIEAEQALASQSITDVRGHFQLKTHVGSGKFKPGIAAGRYAITITKLDTAGIANTLAPPKDLLPNRFSNPGTSGLTADVASGKKKQFDFALTDD